MTNKEDGGPAFPRAEGESSAPRDGMTLRDWFAGQAIGGMLASQYVSEHAGLYKTDAGMVEGLALRSYQIADAMLAARDAL